MSECITDGCVKFIFQNDRSRPCKTVLVCNKKKYKIDYSKELVDLTINFKFDDDIKIIHKSNYKNFILFIVFGIINFLSGWMPNLIECRALRYVFCGSLIDNVDNTYFITFCYDKIEPIKIKSISGENAIKNTIKNKYSNNMLLLIISTIIIFISIIAIMYVLVSKK